MPISFSFFYVILCFAIRFKSTASQVKICFFPNELTSRTPKSVKTGALYNVSQRGPHRIYIVKAACLPEVISVSTTAFAPASARETFVTARCRNYVIVAAKLTLHIQIKWLCLSVEAKTASQHAVYSVIIMC